MSKLFTCLLAASPFLAYLAWAAWWLITDALQDRKQARTAAQEAQPASTLARRSTQQGQQEPTERVHVLIHSGLRQ
jgi:threonine/homoserine/homoserine lactone efflux protein